MSETKTLFGLGLPELAVLGGLGFVIASALPALKNKVEDGVNSIPFLGSGGGGASIFNLGDMVSNLMGGQQTVPLETIALEQGQQNRSALQSWLNTGGKAQVKSNYDNSAIRSYPGTDVKFDFGEYANIKANQKNTGWYVDMTTGKMVFPGQKNTGSQNAFNSGITASASNNVYSAHDYNSVLNRLRSAGWSESSGIKSAAKFLSESEGVKGHEVVKNPGINNAGHELLKTVYNDGSYELRSWQDQIVGTGNVHETSVSQRQSSNESGRQNSLDRYRKAALSGDKAAQAYLDRYGDSSDHSSVKGSGGHTVGEKSALGNTWTGSGWT